LCDGRTRGGDEEEKAATAEHAVDDRGDHAEQVEEEPAPQVVRRGDDPIHARQ